MSDIDLEQRQYAFSVVGGPDVPKWLVPVEGDVALVLLIPPHVTDDGEIGFKFIPPVTPITGRNRA